MKTDMCINSRELAKSLGLPHQKVINTIKSLSLYIDSIGRNATNFFLVSNDRRQFLITELGKERFMMTLTPSMKSERRLSNELTTNY